MQKQPVAKRHHEVSGSLALLLYCCEVSEGSRAVAPTGDKVLQNGEKFGPSIHESYKEILGCKSLLQF